MRDTARTSGFGRRLDALVARRPTVRGLRLLVSRGASQRSVQQTAQRIGIALIVALLWQLASCSKSPAANTPQSEPGMNNSSGYTSGAVARLSPSAPGPLSTADASATPPQESAAALNGRKCNAPPVIAHRGQGGSSAALPENTSAAELEAAREGATLLNVDVRWTNDDVPVAIHDPTLNRTTTGNGPVSAITAAQFQALSLKSNDSVHVLAGKHPQTLAQLLAGIKATGLPIVLQMEADPFSGGAGQASINTLAAAISASGYGNEVVVGGWAADDVTAFSRTDPGVRTAYIQESGNPTAASILSTGAHVLYIDYAKLTAAQITAWHAGGVAVWAWTPAYPDQWAHLRTLGVDAIATNWLGNYTGWAHPCPAVLPAH